MTHSSRHLRHHAHFRLRNACSDLRLEYEIINTRSGRITDSASSIAMADLIRYAASLADEDRIQHTSFDYASAMEADAISHHLDHIEDKRTAMAARRQARLLTKRDFIRYTLGDMQDMFRNYPAPDLPDQEGDHK